MSLVQIETVDTMLHPVESITLSYEYQAEKFWQFEENRMKIYDKEVNDRYRNYYNVFLNYLNDESIKIIKKVIFAYPSPIKQVHMVRNNKLSILDKIQFSEFFRNPNIITIKNKNVINLYLKNDYGQNLRIEFWQQVTSPNISMSVYFEFDDYKTGCPYDFFHGYNLEYIDECMKTFRRIIDIWIKDVVEKFNAELGIDGTFHLD